MQLIRYPQEMVPIMDQVLKDEMLEMAYDDQKEGREGMGGDMGLAEIELMETQAVQGSPYGAEAINMRELNPSDIDKLVTVRGLVIRATPIIPEMKQAFFRCLVCNTPFQSRSTEVALPSRIDALDKFATYKDPCRSFTTVASFRIARWFASKKHPTLYRMVRLLTPSACAHMTSLSTSANR